MLKLTEENYHSLEANQQYMSVSQFKSFQRCEAAALAKVKGEYEEGESDALLLGSYVHAHFEGCLQKFKDDHPQLISSRGASKGELLSKFKNADKMIAAIESQPLAMFVLDGEAEVILTAEIGGVMWKAKLDKLAASSGRFTDIKTTRDMFSRTYKPEYGAYVSFIEAYDYPLQMAVYAEMERLNAGRDYWLEPIIVAVSNEEEPIVRVIGGFAERIDVEIELMKERLPHVIDVKTGKVEPRRCGKCTYCRKTEQLTSIIHYADLTYE